MNAVGEPENGDEAAKALLDQLELSHSALISTRRAEITERLSELYDVADELIGDVVTLRDVRCTDQTCTACLAHADRRDAAALIATAVRALNGARALIRPASEGTR